jgi:thiamine pyrophosphokinase
MWQPVHGSAVLVANGAPPSRAQVEFFAGPDAHLVAVDGGYFCLNTYGIAPDVVMGDLDSVAGLDLTCPSLALPDQNHNDLEKAMMHLCDHGVTEMIILGAWGGARLDHALANLDCVTRYASRARIRMLCDKTWVHGFAAGAAQHRLCLPLDAPFGILPAVPDTVVTITGAAYPLTRAPLPPGSMGVGNRAAAEVVTLEVHQGAVRLLLEATEIPD